MAHPIFKTERLRLRPIPTSDAKGLHTAYGDATAMRFWDTLPSRDLAETRARIPRNTARFAMWTVLMYALLADEWHARCPSPSRRRQRPIATRVAAIGSAMMEQRRINAPDAPAPPSRYSQAVEITGAKRLLYVSGQIPVAKDGHVPADFRAQARQAWVNVEAQLRAAGMTLDNVVKVTIFLADRRHAMENRAVRQEVLGERAPALTVIITGIFDEAWLIEIEAVAAA